MAKVQTSFKPLDNGFQFVNRFEYRFPVKYPLPLVGQIDLNDVVFGLCGGMCFAALDYFNVGQKLPGYFEVDEVDRKLFTYLCERQLDSLKIPTLLKIIEWMLSEDDDLAAKMTRTEIRNLRKSLDKGQPVVMLLIRVKGFGNPTLNHQVLATGYEIDEARKAIKITLYDPNHPCDEPTITAGLSKNGFNISQSSGEALRGFFLVPYAPQKALPRIFATANAAVADAAISFDVGTPGFSLQWPVDSRMVNQYFGENPDSYKGFGLPGHEGLDLYALSGANVYACADGDVTEAGSRSGSNPYGVQVRLKHVYDNEVFQTVYAHLQECRCTVGQKVKAGDLIGLADNTGNSFGSHLHLTLKKEGATTPGYPNGIIDPWPYLKGASTPPDEPPPSASGITVYTTSQVNLRVQPNTTAEIIASLPASESLAVLGDADSVRPKIGQPEQWLQVQTAAATVGWVAAWLVSLTKQEAFPPSGVVVYAFDSVNLRSGPGTAFELLGSVPSSEPLSVLGDADSARGKIGMNNQWLQVQTLDGKRGFVAAWLVHLTGQAPPPTTLTIYVSDMVNVRARPQADSNIMTVVTAGDALVVVGDKAQSQTIIGQQGQWLNVMTPNRMIGWVAAWLVTTSKPGVQPGAAAAVALTVYPTGDVNLRAQPSANAPRVTGAVKNEALKVVETDLVAAKVKIGKQDQWMYAQKKDGSRGWVAAWFLSATTT